MPTYGYKCKSCDFSFDIIQGINEAELEKCPSCGGQVKRQIHGGLGVIFKGTGFYVNDSKKSSSNLNTSNSTSSAASTSKVEATEAKVVKNEASSSNSQGSATKANKNK